MIRIPPEGSNERGRLIAEHKACIESMHGVAGCTILRCATPGDTTDVSGGIHEDILLNRVLLRMRAQPATGKLLVWSKGNETKPDNVSINPLGSSISYSILYIDISYNASGALLPRAKSTSHWISELLAVILCS